MIEWLRQQTGVHKAYGQAQLPHNLGRYQGLEPQIKFNPCNAFELNDKGRMQLYTLYLLFSYKQRTVQSLLRQIVFILIYNTASKIIYLALNFVLGFVSSRTPQFFVMIA